MVVDDLLWILVYFSGTLLDLHSCSDGVGK